MRPAGATLRLFAQWLHPTTIKGKTNQEVVFGKLSVDILDAILSNPGENIDPSELKILLENISSGPVDTSRLRGPIDGGHF